MALKDVKEYYYHMTAQFMELKADLADFEEAFAKGYITEDKLEAVKEELIKVEVNYERLSYIMYLLEMPNKKQKKPGYAARNATLVNFFADHNADMDSVIVENKSSLDNLRAELKRLTEEVGN